MYINRREDGSYPWPFIKDISQNEMIMMHRPTSTWVTRSVSWDDSSQPDAIYRGLVIGANYTVLPLLGSYLACWSDRVDRSGNYAEHAASVVGLGDVVWFFWSSLQVDHQDHTMWSDLTVDPVWMVEFSDWSRSSGLDRQIRSSTSLHPQKLIEAGTFSDWVHLWDEHRVLLTCTVKSCSKWVIHGTPQVNLRGSLDLVYVVHKGI